MDSTDNKLSAFGGGVMTGLCLYWFWADVLVHHTSDNPPWVFLDYANLIFHEGGHVVFLFFGDFLHVLGGSLMQLLVPAICLVAFIRQQENLSAGFCLFWLGESGVNLSYYIADARAQALPLLGGDPSGHDWTWLLTHMNLLQSDTAIGNVVRVISIMAMLSGLIWMAYSVYQKATT